MITTVTSPEPMQRMCVLASSINTSSSTMPTGPSSGGEETLADPLASVPMVSVVAGVDGGVVAPLDPATAKAASSEIDELTASNAGARSRDMIPSQPMCLGFAEPATTVTTRSAVVTRIVGDQPVDDRQFVKHRPQFNRARNARSGSVIGARG